MTTRLGQYGAMAAALLLVGCMTAVPQREVRTADAVQHRIAAGMEYLQMGKPNEARQHLSRAVELDNRNAPAHNAMALLYKYEGDDEREAYHYRQALRADKNFSPARNNLGILMYQKGDYRRALREFERAANDPGYNNRGAAFENMARCHLALGNRLEAIEYFNRSLRLTPDVSTTLVELGNLYLLEDNPRIARRYMDQYDRVVQTPSASALWLGVRLAAKEGDSARQAELERKLSENFPNSAETRAWRAWRDDMARGAAG
ncbi:MAG: type IV pilus biogenesis/stability protein PilW [Alcanivorax sp.]|nr:type IV pilus biogenesis/stability protein PilW [Alcanivorax sp.]